MIQIEVLEKLEQPKKIKFIERPPLTLDDRSQNRQHLILVGWDSLFLNYEIVV
jgi:hypothetical protein